MKRAIFFLLIATLAQGLYAQKYTGAEAAKKVAGCQSVWVNPSRHFISFLQPAADKPVTEAGHLAWLTKSLSLPSNYSFALLRKEADKIGYTHYRYNILYKQLPIQNAVYYVHVKDGKVQSANGEYPAMEPVATVASISQTNAYTVAVAKFGTGQLRESLQEKPTLTYIEEQGKVYLTYKFDLYSPTAHKRQYVFVYATNGTVITTVNRIHTNDVPATAYTRYNGVQSFTTDYTGSNYRLVESARGGGISTTNEGVDFTNATTVWHDITTYNLSAGYDVHFGLEATYDFYLNRYGRNSWDNFGIPVTANYLLGQQYDNSYWDGTTLNFGDGDGIDLNPLTSLDVVGHEYTHAVTQYTAGLQGGEADALNESFSDIFGLSINFQVHPTTATFVMGALFSINPAYERDLSWPKNTNNPDTYLGINWAPGMEPHQNSTVQSHWFYLLTQGGQGTNDNNDVYNVTGIGLTKAEDITYRNLTVYLTPSATYQDACDYAIQAANDLYGTCSTEATQCTNAWYAVGVGSQFSSNVTANFSADKVYSCSLPATINFTSLGTNVSTYLWDFGDHQSSTLQNPTHVYTSAGTYTVKLKVTGAAGCGFSADSVTAPSYITISSTTVITPASCSPNTIYNYYGYGITNVSFGNIYNNTAGAVDGYQDYTCQFAAAVTEGTSVTLDVTSETNNERIKVWLDLNNDGIFTDNEMIANGDDYYGLTQQIIIPHPNVYNTPLRLRIGSDYDDSSVLVTACTPSNYGQYEDYSIAIAPNVNPPIADFTVNNYNLFVGDTAFFIDYSTNVPTSWKWYFPGGTPSTSTAQNPTVIYDTAGIYLAKLVVYNANGSDSITKTNYITVSNGWRMCHSSGSVADTGTIYDSGGPNGIYQPSEDCGFLIDAPCASSITLNFQNFSTDDGYDFLMVYDGIDANAPLLGQFTGYYPPSPLTSTTGKMYLLFQSSPYSNYDDGFTATWRANSSTLNAPVTQFVVSDSITNINNSILFADNSTNQPTSWLWNFGDGTTSNSRIPFHSYPHAGSYTVTLTTTNCAGSSESSVTIQVLAPIENGINNVSQSTTVNLFPNPNNGQFQLELSSGLTGEYGLSVFAMDGKQVYTGRVVKDTGVYTATVDLVGIASGIYTATLTAPNGQQYHRKLVVR